MISARLDDEAGLLQGLADGRLVDGLVDLEEPARLGPGADGRLDAAPDQDDLAGVGDRQGGRDEARVDVGDVAAARAGERGARCSPCERSVARAGPAARAVVERRREPGRDAAARGDVRRPSVGTAAAASIRRSGTHAS